MERETDKVRTAGTRRYPTMTAASVVEIRGANCGEVVMTMNREQAQKCYDALMTEPMRDYGPQECAECFLIVQLADALGHPVIKPIRDRASVIA